MSRYRIQRKKGRLREWTGTLVVMSAFTVFPMDNQSGNECPGTLQLIVKCRRLPQRTLS